MRFVHVHAMKPEPDRVRAVAPRHAAFGSSLRHDAVRALAESSTADTGRVSAVSKWMTRDPMTIGPDESVSAAMNDMLFGGSGTFPSSSRARWRA